jgi:hypothetical protein
VQATGAHARRVIRVGLSPGGLAARHVQVLAEDLPSGRAPIVGTLWGDELLYVVTGAESGPLNDGESVEPAPAVEPAVVVRRLRLR